MASIIPGYEYDIFISYRHNDNRSGWVTEFVVALQEELAATLKEPVSVYFDTNPHDGLLETHDVDKSLEGKLKCLIFIPIISQTYCDPKSFAWMNEFIVFNKMAKKDLFSRDIKLSSGNVTSRILPVKIHDLDLEDKSFLENELGGVLRSIEFIYKASGVNRPLKLDDERAENLNHTYYRDQINKVANAVKEIINAIKKYELHGGEISKDVFISKPVSARKLNPKFIIGSLIVLAILVFGYFFIPKQFKSSEPIKKSIVVLPFENMSNDPENEYFCKGVVEAINRNLSQIGELRVISMVYKDLSKNLKKSTYEISKELSVAYLLEGSIQRSENTIRIEVKLIDAKTEAQLWADKYDRELHDIFRIQGEIAENVAFALQARITPKEKTALNHSMTNNTKAYDIYLKGIYEINTFTRNGIYKAIEYFKQAVELDSTFALAYVGIAQCSILKAGIFGAELSTNEAFKEALPYLKKATDLEPDLPQVHLWTGFYLLYNNWDFEGAQKEYEKSISSNNNEALRMYGDFLNFVNKDSDALIIAQRLNKSDPFYPNSKMVAALYYIGKYKEATEFALSRLKLYNNFSSLEDYGFLMLNTDHCKESIGSFQKLIALEGIRYPRTMAWMGAAYARLGQRDSAMVILEDLKAKNNSAHVGSINFFMAVIYAALGDKNSAIHCLQEAYKYHEMEIPWLKSEPQFYLLRDDPEFQDLIRKVGFP